MRGNPELRRNLWLELSPQRLIAAPAIAAMAAFVVLRLEEMPLDVKRIFPAMFFVLLTAVMGSRHAADALASEITNGTWDSQRMSSLNAWSMSWGKLFGATIFDWYCGALALIVFVAIGTDRPMAETVLHTLQLIAVALLAQLAAMFGTIVHRWRRQNERRARALWGQGLGLLVLFFLFPFVSPPLEEYQVANHEWYNVSLSAAGVVLITLGVGAAWLMIGIHRLMRVELQYRNLPWVWPAFLLFATFYIGGFSLQRETGVPPELWNYYLGGFLLPWESVTPLAPWPYILLFVAVGSIYLIALVEPKGIVRYRWLLADIRARSWRRAFERLPLWVSSYVLCVAGGVAVVLSFDPSGVTPMMVERFGNPVAIWTVVIAGLLFILRDMAAIMFFGLGGRRGDMASFAYLFVSYWLLGSLVVVFGEPMLVSFTFPFAQESLWLTVLPPLAEAAVAIWLFWRRFKARSGTGSTVAAAAAN